MLSIWEDGRIVSTFCFKAGKLGTKTSRGGSVFKKVSFPKTAIKGFIRYQSKGERSDRDLELRTCNRQKTESAQHMATRRYDGAEVERGKATLNVKRSKRDPPHFANDLPLDCKVTEEH